MKRLLISLLLLPSLHATVVLDGGSIPGLVRQVWSAGGFRAFWFDVGTPQADNRVVNPSSTTTVYVQDRKYIRTVGASTVTDFLWPYTVSPLSTTTETITRSSSNESVIVPDPTDDSKWTWVSNGSATLTITCSSRTVNEPVTASTGGAATVDTFDGYATDSLHYALADAVDSRIAGKSVSTALKILSTYDNTTPTYVRNVSCWAYDLDLTAISPWNSTGGVTRAGILISPRHILFAAHYQLNTGATVRFVATDNTVVTRTMTAKATLPGYSPYYPDITVGVLDSDVPASVAFARVLPDGWASYLPGSLVGIPALTLDQEENALVTDLSTLTGVAGTYGAMASYIVPTNPQRLAFYQAKVGGDSGNPACLIVGTQLVLFNVWTFGGAGSGTSVTYWKSAINTLMSDLGGGYQLTDVDLSGYPSY